MNEDELARRRRWHQANPEKSAAIHRRWRQRNPEKVRAQKQLYYERHREKMKAKQQAYREADPDKVRAQKQAHYQRNADRLKAAAGAWRNANPGKTQHWRRQRKAATRGSRGTIARRDWLRLVRRYRGLCAYCQKQPYAEMDHVVPLSRGGRHTIGNVLPACQACNSSKHAWLLIEWRSRPDVAYRA